MSGPSSDTGECTNKSGFFFVASFSSDNSGDDSDNDFNSFESGGSSITVIRHPTSILFHKKGRQATYTPPPTGVSTDPRRFDHPTEEYDPEGSVPIDLARFTRSR